MTESEKLNMRTVIKEIEKKTSKKIDRLTESMEDTEKKVTSNERADRQAHPTHLPYLPYLP